jgi:pSer/pThr/pTyr-binding forkhead associated (FHA) protein
MAAILIILSGKHQGKRLTLPEGEAVIGRDESCQIRLATNEVSRQHCRLMCEGDRVVVHDLGSRNGTLVNDVAIHGQAELQAGDILRVGPVAFQLAGKKSSTTAPAKKSPSDDSIMDWLADEEGEDGSGDTTIVRKDPAPLKPVAPTPIPEDQPTPLPAQRKFKTVGAEGEDIIQRHYELVQAGKLPKRIPALKTEQ